MNIVDDVEKPNDGHNSQWWSADAWWGHSVCQRTGYILDNESPRGYASSLIARKSYAMNTDTHMNGSVVKNHISLKPVFEYNVTRRTSFRSWFQACQQVLHPVLILQHQWHLQDRRVREVRIWVNTVLKLISLKTEIARSARGPKLQEHRAEDALAEPYLVQIILVIWWQQITKYSMKIVDLETVIDLLSWCRTWPPNGSSQIRAKQKLLRKHREACKSSWSPIGSLKSFTLTIPWNLARPVKIFPGIIVRWHHTDRKQMGLLKGQCAEWKNVPLQYCCNRV